MKSDLCFIHQIWLNQIIIIIIDTHFSKQQSRKKMDSNLLGMSNQTSRHLARIHSSTNQQNRPNSNPDWPMNRVRWSFHRQWSLRDPSEQFECSTRIQRGHECSDRNRFSNNLTRKNASPLPFSITVIFKTYSRWNGSFRSSNHIEYAGNLTKVVFLIVTDESCSKAYNVIVNYITYIWNIRNVLVSM